MSYSCLEELQVDLDLHALDKTSILSKAGSKYDNKWFVVTDDGHCHLFDSNGNLDDIKKITHLKEEYIRKDITKIVIPNSVTSIGEWTFQRCSWLTSVTIPDSVTSIGHDTFDNCSGITNVTIPNSVTSIGYLAFYGCSGLTNVTIGNGVTDIGSYAFSGCNWLMSVMIPDSVTNIHRAAFNNCNSLTSLIFEGKTFEQVKKMNNYPWEIEDESIIKVK